ncbi:MULTISPECIES: A24 family peptidase [unclassified Nocardiopsis]|uniref:prepilin peptidase n=1 Tax=unclassified Nocardiopsis TaxID=2649073 RepID=UPI00135B7C98|nr:MULTISPECIES: A24 family peptidase [unclassified Nocardiopsis]
MPTPSALVLGPHLWTILVAVLLILLGAVVGQLNGRLVHLFGPAPSPGPRGSLAAPRRRARPPEEPADTAAGPAFPEYDEGPPPPRCPQCRAELRFLRWFPAVEARTFRRRGACPHCEQVIRSDPAVTAVTAALFGCVGLWAVPQPHWCPFSLLALLWLVALGVLLSAIDVRVMRLPDAVVAPSYAVTALLIGAAVLLPPEGPDLDRAGDALLGMALVTVLYWLLWRVNGTGLGFGDVKLSGLTGLYTGWAAGPLGALVSVFWAFAAFSLVGLVLMALRRLTRRDPFPLGPFMLAATLATVLAGQPLLP